MDIKTAGDLKNSTLLDWNADTEGSEREFTNSSSSSSSTGMHNCSHDIEEPCAIQTSTVS